MLLKRSRGLFINDDRTNANRRVHRRARYVCAVTNCSWPERCPSALGSRLLSHTIVAALLPGHVVLAFKLPRQWL